MFLAWHLQRLAILTAAKVDNKLLQLAATSVRYLFSHRFESRLIQGASDMRKALCCCCTTVGALSPGSGILAIASY